MVDRGRAEADARYAVCAEIVAASSVAWTAETTPSVAAVPKAATAAMLVAGVRGLIPEAATIGQRGVSVDDAGFRAVASHAV